MPILKLIAAPSLSFSSFAAGQARRIKAMLFSPSIDLNSSTSYLAQPRGADDNRLYWSTADRKYLRDFVHYVHAVHNSTEGDGVTVEVWSWSSRDIKLGSIGVDTAINHG